MAGAGYKLFNTGDVLTAAQVNTYLQEQVVMVFANAAARTTALASVLAEGMVSYLKDTDATEVYNGSAWVGIGNSGDITGITTGATSGLTGGVTSGTADLKLNTTAKGGLLVGTGSGTVTELSVGSNNTVLTADSSTASGLKWATVASGGGKVLQVVTASTTTATTVASTTYTDTGLSASITPTASTSTILVMVSQRCYQSRSAESTNAAMQIVRGSTSIFNANDSTNLNIAGTTLALLGGYTTLIYRDSPATTSSTTYKTQGKVSNTANSGQIIYQADSSPSTITLLEIGA